MAEKISLAGYTFAANKATYACKHVWEGSDPVLVYAHDREGDLQVLCGADSHTTAEGVMLCLHDVVDRHADLATLPVVKKGELAERDSPKSSWKVSKL